MAVALSLLAAVAFAAGTVLQQRGALRAPAGEDDARFLAQILREPVWVVGALLQAAGWILQAAAVVTAGLAAFGRSRRGAARAALFGTAAGVAFALQAAVTKVFVGELGHGVINLLSTWSTYVLIVTALAGFVLQQSALKTGVLAPAMAASNASTLAFSVVFGIRIFDESLAHGSGHATAAWVGLALAILGVVRLASAQAPAERVAGG